jgi:integrase
MIDHLRKRGRIWYWRYRPHGERGQILEVSLGTPDKQSAEKKRGELRQEKERERAKILAPKEMREAAQRSLSEHVSDFVKDVLARGKTEKYAGVLEVRLNRLIAECGWKQVSSVTADSFVTWRTRQKMAPKTFNEYLNAISGLLNWMRRQARIAANPLQVVGKVETRGRDTRERRALTDAEMRKLLAVSGKRKAVYLMAVFTGLRRGELRQLQWRDVHLEDAAQPFVVVRASTTKNHEQATIKLHQDVVVALREWREECGDIEGAVFTVPKMKTFRKDLEKAGIPYRDAESRVADFHSLRGTLCTNLQNASVGTRTAQEIMRHSDPRLTAKVYTDTSKLHTWSAIDKLPSLLGNEAEALPQILPQKLCVGGIWRQNVAQRLSGGMSRKHL